MSEHDDVETADDDDTPNQASERVFKVKPPPKEMRTKRVPPPPSYRSMAVDALNAAMDLMVIAGKLHGKPDPFEDDELAEYPTLEASLPALNKRLAVVHTLLKDVAKRSKSKPPAAGKKPARPAGVAAVADDDA